RRPGPPTPWRGGGRSGRMGRLVGQSGPGPEPVGSGRRPPAGMAVQSPHGRESLMRRSPVFWCTLVLLVGLAVGLGPAPASAQSADSLYKRLGGYDAIAAVVDDLIGRMVADPELKKF